MATSFGLQEKNVYELYFHQNGKQEKKKEKKRTKKWRWQEVMCVGRAAASMRQNFCTDLIFYLYRRIKKKKSPILNELGKKETYFQCLNSKHKENHVHVSVTTHSYVCLFTKHLIFLIGYIVRGKCFRKQNKSGCGDVGSQYQQLGD